MKIYKHEQLNGDKTVYTLIENNVSIVFDDFEITESYIKMTLKDYDLDFSFCSDSKEQILERIDKVKVLQDELMKFEIQLNMRYQEALVKELSEKCKKKFYY